MSRTKSLVLISAFAFIHSVVFSDFRKIVSRKKGLKIATGEGSIRGYLQFEGVNSSILDVKISGSDIEGVLSGLQLHY